MVKKFLCLTCKHRRTEVPEEFPKTALASIRKISVDEVTDKMVCDYLQELGTLFKTMKATYPKVFYCSAHYVIVAGAEGTPTQVRSECPEYEIES